MSATDQTQMTALAQASSAAHPVPDRGHVNNYREDTELQQLLALYLPADLYAHLQPYFDRMGELAGGAVDEQRGAAGDVAGSGSGGRNRALGAGGHFQDEGKHGSDPPRRVGNRV